MTSQAPASEPVEPPTARKASTAATGQAERAVVGDPGTHDPAGASEVSDQPDPAGTSEVSDQPDPAGTSEVSDQPDPAGTSEASAQPDPAGTSEASDPGEAPDPGGAAREVPVGRHANQLVISRPPEMVLGAVFLTLAAAPLVVAGLALLLQLGRIGPALARGWPGVAVETVVVLARVTGFVLLLIGLLYIGLTWFACRPRRWARTGVTAFAVVEVVLLVVGMILTAVDPVSLGLVLLAGAGAVLLYLPRAEEFLIAAR